MSAEIPPTIDYATPVPPRRRGPGIWIALGVGVPGIAFMLSLGALFAARRAAQAKLQAAQAQAVRARSYAEVGARAHREPRGPGKVYWMTLARRSSMPIPETHDRAIVHIGDIAQKKVQLNIDDASGNPLLNSTSVGEGDVRRFDLAGQALEIEVIDLLTIPGNDDYATFEVRPAGTGLSKYGKIKQPA